MNRHDFEVFLCELFDVDVVPSMIKSQTRKFITEHGYTYKNIARALYFYHIVEENEYEDRYGIGIVPSIMPRAIRYFEEEAKKHHFNQEQAEKLKQAQTQPVKTIKVRPKPAQRKGIKKIDITKL